MWSMIKKRLKKSLKKKKEDKWSGHNYQRYCVARGFEQKFLAFFLDPGLGKTTIILQLFKMLLLHDKSKGLLIIAPIRVCYLVWPLEVLKWSNFRHFKINIMHGYKKNLWDKAECNIHIINPDGLPWLLNQLKGKRKTSWPFDVLVVDESTAFKTYKSSRFKHLKKLVPKFGRRYILTGTPIPNGYMQLFSQIRIVDEGRSLGTKIGHFRKNHFKKVGKPEWNQWELLPNEDEVINRRISNFVVRMSADDYLDLPPLIENIIHVELPKKIRKYYDELEKTKFLTINGNDIYPPTPASVGQKLHQICGGNLYKDWDVVEMGPVPPSKDRPYFHLHKEKNIALQELHDELNGKPLFVAYWYHHELTEIKKFFKNPVVINSKTSEKEAVKIEKLWNSGKLPLLFAQPASVAHGLNFQKAGGDICWYSLINDFEISDQFIKRVWRQGVKKSPTIHYIITRNSIEEAMYARLRSKEDNQNRFFDMLKKYQQLKFIE